MNKIKKVITSLLMIAAITAVMISCKKDDPAPTLSITPSQSAVVFKADGTPDGNAAFTVATNQSAWDAVSSQTWCTVTKTAAGFTLSATANASATAPAPATITVTAAGATSIVINATQAAAGATLSVSPQQTAIAFAADGTTADNAAFTVSTNTGAWDAVSSQTWCTVTKTAAGFTVSAAANTAFTAPAPATVTVTAGEATPIVINVTQAAATDFTETGVSGVSFEMVAVAGGTFTMGAADDDPDAYSDEKPAHAVTLSDFYIGRVEVTQALWLAVIGSWPGTAPSSTYGLGDSYPAYNVSWDDVQTFISALNARTGKTYRLPTEAEWEYAARGGAQSGGYSYSGSNTIDDVAWYSGNSGNRSHEVGGKDANELGIYDMSGNVWEWCSDWYGAYTADAQTDPAGPVTGFDRVIRGGGWVNFAGDCRVSLRSGVTLGVRSAGLGFRLACSSQ
jgi:formylglycine-generating enzyme required for sulfatase activity